MGKTKVDTNAHEKTIFRRFQGPDRLEVLKESKTVAQIASEHQLHPNLVTKWRQEAVAELPVVFERRNTQAQAQEAPEQKVAQLYEQIGRLITQVSWLKKIWPRA